MKKIKTGKVEIGSNEFNPKNGKFRLNMLLDLDVVDQIRKVAASKHVPYQTLINQRLRELFLEGDTLENRVTRLEKLLKKQA